MAASDHFTWDAILVGTILCVVTHGVFIGTGFEEYLYNAFGSSHVHGSSLAMASGHEGHLHGAFTEVADVSTSVGAESAPVVEPVSSAREAFGTPVPQ